MTTAIIGAGNIGSAVARHLVDGGESVVVAAKDESHADALAKRARAAGTRGVRRGRDRRCRRDRLRSLARRHERRDLGAHVLLDGKVVVDPSNPLGFDATGQMIRTLPDDQSAGAIVAALLPAAAHYVKAFGTLGADSLANSANREPRPAVLFYATDDDEAKTTIERLIHDAGFDPVKAGGVAAAGRIEMPGGDLHQFGLNGELLDLDQARAAIAASEVPV